MPHDLDRPAPSIEVAPAREKVSLRAGLDPLLASCLWGGMYVVSRASFAAIPPVTLGASRVVIGGAALLLAGRLARRRGAAQGARWTRRDHLRAVLLGLLVTGTILTQFLGTDLASAHDGALLTTLTPVFVVPLAWALLGERPGWRVLGGTLLALAGVAIVVAAQTSGGGASSAMASGRIWLGDALLLVSALCWALFTVAGAPLIRTYSALSTATAATLWSIPMLVPLAAIELATSTQPLSLTPSSLAAVLYLGLGATALAWFLWYRGIEHLPAGIAAVFFFAQPVVGGVLSSVFLHETPPPSFWLGGAVLAGGILLVSWSPGNR